MEWLLFGLWCVALGCAGAAFVMALAAARAYRRMYAKLAALDAYLSARAWEDVARQSRAPHSLPGKE
jgi:hypothetical protein